MYYGLQLSASAVLTSLYRADVYAGNLANINTTGFKPDMPHERQRDPARIEDGIASLPSNELLEKLGAGVHMAPNTVNYGQGPITETGNDLDVAIQGEGFFVLLDAANRNQSGLLYTRDGRFLNDSTGKLIHSATGLPVLSTGGGAINLDPNARVEIQGDGSILQNNALVGQLRLADAPDRDQLRKVGAGTFRPSSNAINNAVPATGRLMQGALENSGVDEISALMSVQKATGAVGRNIAMIQYQDRMMERAINTFGRVS